MTLVRQLTAEVDRCGRRASRIVVHYGMNLSSVLNNLEIVSIIVIILSRVILIQERETW